MKPIIIITTPRELTDSEKDELRNKIKSPDQPLLITLCVPGEPCKLKVIHDSSITITELI